MLSYAVLLAVLFIGVSIYMYNYYSETIRQNTVDNSINKLSRIRYENEANIGAILNTGSQMGLSPYVVPFRFSEEPWNAYQLKKQIMPYTVTNSFYDQLFLIFDNDDYLYSSLTTVRLDLFLNQIMLFENIAPEELKALIRTHNGISILNCQNVTSSLLDGKNTRMVTIIVPLGESQALSEGSLIFMIKESTYLELFTDEINEESNTYILYNGSVMVNSRNLDIPDGLILDAVKTNEKTMETEITYNGAKYLLVALSGQMNGMQYCTVMPLKSLTTHMDAAQLGFWLFLFGLSVPCIFLVYYFAQRNYKPIKDLRHMFADAGAGSDDFVAIRAGISNLVGRNVDLNSRLDESVSVRRSGFVTNFVKYRFGSRQACVDAAARLGMHIDRKYYVVALVGLAPGTDSLSIGELAGMKGEGADGYGAELIALEQMIFALFSDDPQALDEWAGKALEASRALSDSVAVSMSDIHGDFSEATNAYLEANAAFDHRFIMGNARVLRFGDVSASAKATVPHTRSYMDALKKSLRSGDAEAVTSIIDELFSYLGGINMSLFTFRLIYNEIISVMLSDQIGKAGSVDALRMYDVFTLSSCRSIDDLDDMLRKLCGELLKKEKPALDGAHPEIERIVEFMNENFADPNLNMSAIADRFGLSAARLSLDFKELMGMSPSDYLLLLRMEKSKELLSTTDMSIKDVCAAVGYFDTSGFIRRFRGYLAMTPLQYRQNTKSAMK
jgi:AraC-like DNA-binding protein